MLYLERKASLIVTDSGGVQKEAYFNKTPCVTARTETEWVELVEQGWNQLADPTDPGSIPKCVRGALNKDLPDYNTNLYGDAQSAKHMVDILINH